MGVDMQTVFFLIAIDFYRDIPMSFSTAVRIFETRTYTGIIMHGISNRSP